MPNQHVLQRLQGIQTILNGVHHAGVSMSTASKGQERATFIDQFLSKALPPAYRFGTGDATDVAGRRSGQLDVVIENPFTPSLPLPAGASRLYLAEGIAAVVEVKSDVANQWNDAKQTASKLAELYRGAMVSSTTMTFSYGRQNATDTRAGKIPIYVVGYTGWQKPETVHAHLANASDVDGILVISSGIFVGRINGRPVTVLGPWALWGLITGLYNSVNSLQAAFTDLERYAT